MRILIISKYFPPENSIASLRPYSWAKYWSRAGHDVSVLTSPKDYNDPNAVTFKKENFQIFEIDYNRLFYQVRSYYRLIKKSNRVAVGKENALAVPVQEESNPSNSPIKKLLEKAKQFIIDRGIFATARMPDFMDFWVSSSVNWAKKNGSWDLVISTHGPYACHIIGYNLKKNNLTKFWIADFRDLWTDNHIYKGVFPFTFIESILERRLMRAADIITTVSKPLASTLAKKYGFKKVNVIENGFDTEDLSKIPVDKFFNDSKVRIIYSGSVYKGKQNPLPLFDAIGAINNDAETQSLLQKLEVIFLGVDNSYILELAEDAGIKDFVKDGGFLPRPTILQIQRDADVLLFLGFDKGKVNGILTGKLFEYINSGTEIWGIGVDINSSPGEVISEAGAGILFGEDIELIKNELIRILKQKTKKRLNLNTKFIEQFERKTLALKLLDLI